MEKEVWKTYPEYSWIEASNLGRIRTKDRYVTVKGQSKRLIKGRVLKQRLSNSGYLMVEFGVDGKSVFRYVHRIIAVCFIPNPFGLPEINHKDNNPRNNAVSNLEWCDHQYNIDYKKNFGTSAVEVSGRPVFAVSLKTGKVLRFKSRAEAARQLGVNRGHIAQVINEKLNQTGGYWFTEDESEITEEKIREIKANMQPCQVIAVNFKTGEVFWFKSQGEAGRQLGVNQASIGRIINGQQNRAGNYWLCNADENAVNKVRDKFGDEVANKVEKLMRER